MALKKYQSYVAYFDLLGFAGLVCADAQKASGLLEKLKKALDEKEVAYLKILSSGKVIHITEFLKFVFFSDTVFYYTLGNTSEELLSIVLGAGRFMAKCMDENLPIRGGICHGDLFIDLKYNIFCGKPAVNAFRLTEKAQWLGLTLDAIVADHYNNCHLLDRELKVGPDAIVQFYVPEKDGTKIKRWCFDWVSPLHPTGNIRGGEHLYETYFRQLFNTRFIDLSPKTQKKYNNTALFFNYVLNKYKHKY